MTQPEAPVPRKPWIRRRAAAGWSVLLLATIAFAVLRTPPSPWVRLPGMEMSSGNSTSTLHAVRFNRFTRELRGCVTLAGVDVAGDVTIDRFEALLIDEVTWQTSGVPAEVSVRVLSPQGPIVLDGRLDRVPNGFYPYGVDVLVSFDRASGERDEAGMSSGMWSYQAIDDEDLDRIVAEGGRAVPGLLRQSYSDDAIQRDIAVMALGRIGSDAADVVPRLRELLGDTHTAVRTSAAHALGRFGTQAEPAVEDLAEIIRDPDDYDIVKRSVLFALKDIGPAAVQAVPELIEVVRGDNHLYRMLAIQAIGAVGPQANAARPTLLELQDEGVHCGNTRKALTEALARIGGA